LKKTIFWSCEGEVGAVFFGANLHALRKKDGGLRPIAVGLTLRRLVSKVANSWNARNDARMASFLAPRQLGDEICGGAEAAVHAARVFLGAATPFQALLNAECFKYSVSRLIHGGDSRKTLIITSVRIGII